MTWPLPLITFLPSTRLWSEGVEDSATFVNGDVIVVHTEPPDKRVTPEGGRRARAAPDAGARGGSETRHGAVRSLGQRAPSAEPSSPVVLHTHGGGFVNRHPEQDRHIARFLAARLG